MATETYPISAFPNNTVFLPTFEDEIRVNGPLAAKLLYTENPGGNVVITFSDALTGGESTDLDGIVAAHQGVQIPPLAAPGQPGGTATLDGGGQLESSQLPTITAGDVGADPAGTGVSEAASAVSAHEAAGDPHPQYTDAAEAAAAAPVQSVNTQTGAVVLGAADVGADPAGSASSVQGNLDTHIADTANPHGTDLGSLGSGTYDELDAAVTNATPIAVFAFGQSQGISTTTSTTFQNKVSMTNLVPFPAGTYVWEVSYGWNHDSQQDDFEARLTFNGGQIGELHKQEPKDSQGADPTGTTQRHYVTRQYFFTLGSSLAAGQTFNLDYRTSAGGNESSIWEAVSIIKRIG